MKLGLAGLRSGLRCLAKRDADLARVIEIHGPPPLWARPPGFVTLIQIILEQQVSLSSAQAAFDRLNGAVAKLTPRSFLALDAAELRRIGFSRQKARYCRELAEKVARGQFEIDGLERLSDEQAGRELMDLTGVGRWTADIYLLMALQRRDVWPSGDLALAKAARAVKGLPRVPDRVELEALGEPWRPWRAVAARILWHHHLSS